MKKLLVLALLLIGQAGFCYLSDYKDMDDWEQWFSQNDYYNFVTAEYGSAVALTRHVRGSDFLKQLERANGVSNSWEAMLEWHFDCKARTYRISATEIYDLNDRRIVDKTLFKFVPIQPNTYASQLFNLTCGEIEMFKNNKF